VKLDQLQTYLERNSVHLWEEQGQLHFRAPKGVMTDALKSSLREHKDAILDALREQAKNTVLIPEPDQWHEPFPLTDVQAAYLLGRRNAFDFGDVGCQVYGELACSEIEHERLDHAWRLLMERHEMLRARIHADGYQTIVPEVPLYKVEIVDLGKGEDDAFAHAVEEARAALSHRNYEPDQWPLFALRLTKMLDRAILHVSIDFLIADYLSIQKLLTELQLLYANPSAKLQQPRIAFRDYVLAERRQRDGTSYLRDRAYWMERLETLPPAPDLPVRSDAAQHEGRFERLSFTLAPEQWASLKRAGGRYNVTPSVAVMSAFAEVVGRWSRRPHFALNLTLLNRQPHHPDVDLLVGDFTSVSLLEVNHRNPASFAARTQAMQAQLWEDMDHRLYSGVELMREIGRRKGRAAAIFPVVFTSTIGLAEAITTGSDWQYISGLSQTPQVWIDCQAIERNDGLTVNWDVRTGVLEDGVLAAMWQAFEHLLTGLSSSPTLWDAICPVALPADQARVQAAAQGEASDFPDARLHDGFLTHARTAPQRPALVDAQGTVSYGELHRMAASVRSTLQIQNVRPGEIVAIVMKKGRWQIAAALGTMMAGAAYLPIETTQPPQRRGRILQDADVRVGLTDQRDPAPDTGAIHWIAATEVTLPGTAETLDPPAPISSDALAYVIYTSGSTGAPKGVMIAHRAAWNTIADVNQRFSVEPDDKILALAGLGFDLSVYDLFGGLTAGACLVIPHAELRGDPTHWAELVEREGITVWNSVPSQMEMLMHVLNAERHRDLPSLRLVLLSGDWIPTHLPERLALRLPVAQVVSLGGATEASIWSIFHPARDIVPDCRTIPYGRPLANQSFHVLNQHGQHCPDRVPGELWIGGAGLALGYLKDEAKTAESFVDHPVVGERLYRTGDIGRYLRDGVIEFLGREDSQVKIRGHRIELAEIEELIASHPAVSSVAVIAHGEARDKRLAAFLTGRADDVPTGSEDSAVVGEAMSTAAGEVLVGIDPGPFFRFVRALDDVAHVEMMATLQDSGLFRELGATATAAEVLTSARVAPRHHRLIRRWLTALSAAGHLESGSDGTSYIARATVNDAARAAAWDGLEAARRAGGYGERLVHYLKTSTGQLPSLMRGEVDAARLLFPGGDTGTVEAIYHDYLVGQYLNAVIVAAVREAAACLPRQPLRVLELGAGVGGTSAKLIPALADLDVDYLFTDVSQFFLNAARDRFAAYPFVRFGVFDLNTEPHAQGIYANSVDIIVAANVLHYAEHASETIDRLKTILSPGGWLVFIEAAGDSSWVMASMEFMEQEIRFRDERAQSDATFMSLDAWDRHLRAAGANVVHVRPLVEEALSDVGQHVLAARFGKETIRVPLDELMHDLRQALPDYMMPQHVEVLDTLPVTQNGKLDRAALVAGFPHADAAPMQAAAPRTDLEQRLAALWADILNLPKLGRDQDFFDSGGDSLLVSQLAGRLRERIPEAANLYFDQILRQILQEPTVAALATLLERQAPMQRVDDDQSPPSPLVPLGGPECPDPIVLVHDVSGTMAPYIALGRALAEKHEVLGLAITKVPLFLDRPPEGLIGQLADEYATLLRGTGRSSFHLFGRFLGGLVAAEVARRLIEIDCTVRLSVLGGAVHWPVVEDEILLEVGFAHINGVDLTKLGLPSADQVATASHAALTKGGNRLEAGCIQALGQDPAHRRAAEAFADYASTPAAERWAAIGRALTKSRGDLDPLGFVEAHLGVFRHMLAAAAAHTTNLLGCDLTVFRPQGEIGFLPWFPADQSHKWEEVVLGRVTTVPLEAAPPAALETAHCSPLVNRLLEGAGS